jgi:hypothetical protein
VSYGRQAASLWLESRSAKDEIPSKQRPLRTRTIEVAHGEIDDRPMSHFLAEHRLHEQRDAP